jgi:beta-glucosidase
MRLPKDFLLGASTSAYQVEGDNSNTDWWYWEQKGKLPESGKADNMYHTYAADFSLAKQIGLNAQRIGIEWARIEPEIGVIDRGEIEHYRKVLAELKSQGFSVMVTLHHFTLPKWAADKGGMFSSVVQNSFVNFSQLIAKELGALVDYWITINEPEVIASMGYMNGIWPPFKKSWFLAYRLNSVLANLHIRTYKAIKAILPDAKIGIAKNNGAFYPARNNVLDRLLVKLIRNFRNHSFLKKINNYQDFIGLNFYFTRWLKFPFSGFDIKTQVEPKTDLSWPIYPEGLKQALLDLKQYNKPIYITENGLADAEDKYRYNYIKDHLEKVLEAKDLGVDVRGYFYWSLLDNFEWADGFKPRFGLIEVDYTTQERKIRESSRIFNEIK